MLSACILLCCSLLCRGVVAGGVSPQAPLSDQHRHDAVGLSSLIEFHKNLTQIESISGNENEVGIWLTESLEGQGYHVHQQYLDKDKRRFNVYAYAGRTKDTKVLVSSHIDTVPPFLPYRHREDVISGRGSVDDKASVATQVVALNKLIAAGNISADDVALLFVVGEETGGDGMRAANALGLKPQSVVFGEPTEGKLISGHKGNLGLTIRAKGKAAHSGYPWLGRSANEVLTKAMAALIEVQPHLPKSDKYGNTTINLGRIEGGVAGNVIAESATASITVRVAAGTPEVVKSQMTDAIRLALQSFLNDDTSFDDVVELDFSASNYGPIDIDHDVPGFDVMTVNYGTDIPWLEKIVEGQKRYLYGPGNIMVAHSDHEALTEDELFGAVEGYERIISYAVNAD